MAASNDDSDEETYVVLGTPLPAIEEGDPIKKPTAIQDLTAKDKQGRRRFHGAFTGGFSAGYFNSVGSKEGFTPSTFVSSRSQRRDDGGLWKPEDFMDDEDLTEYGIAPRKFSTQGEFTSEERKRKFRDDVQKISGSSVIDIGAALSDLIVPENLTIGIKLLRKMGWKEGQGLGPRIKKKKKKKDKKTSGAKVYGCALPPSSDSNSEDSDVPSSLQDVTFAPKDKTPISMTPKDDTHGLGYRGIDPSLALPSSQAVGHSVPVSKSKYGKGIRGQAFGVGAFEDEDEDIYAQDNMSNYDLTMTEGDDGSENLFGWTAPRAHGKQTVPVSYVGKILEGFCISSKPLVPHKKFLPPVLPKNFKPVHWFRRKNIEDAAKGPEKLTAVDRGLLLGETPIMGSVFDLISGQDKARISSTKEAIAMSQALTQPSPSKSRPSSTENETKESPSPTKETTNASKNKEKFLSKFTPASVDSSIQNDNAPLFQGSIGFQPFRKDPSKQARYDKYLSLVKQGAPDPYSQLSDNPLTEWEKARERDEFSMASRLYKPMSAMMSARFVQAAVMDDSKAESLHDDEQTDKPDHVKAAEMKMFGKLTREEFEWHPDKLVCKRFNVPNPYPGSDIVGLPTVKRDKYSIFTFLNFGDYQPSDRQEPSQLEKKPEAVPAKVKELKPITAAQKKAKMASIFSVLDDPDFNKSPAQTETSSQEHISPSQEHISPRGVVAEDEAESAKEASVEEPDVDLFRAIFKNSDSEDTEGSSEEADKESLKDDGEIKEESQSTVEDSSDKHIQENKRNNVEPDLQPIVSDLTGFKASTEQMTNPFASVFKDSKNNSRKSGQNQKSVFSVLEDLSDNEKDKDVQSSEETSEMFGPCLPPPLNISSSTDSSFNHQAPHFHVHEKKKRKDSSRWRERSPEQAKDKSKLKKAKRKKSKVRKKDKKHKKHKKRSSKHKSKKSMTESSGSEADTDSSDDD